MLSNVVFYDASSVEFMGIATRGGSETRDPGLKS